MSPLQELVDTYASYYSYDYYFFWLDPNAYYIVRVYSPFAIKSGYGVKLTLPAEYTTDQTTQEFTCYFYLRDSYTSINTLFYPPN